MSKIVEDLKEKQFSLLNSSNYIIEEILDDLILVFTNPFDKEQYTCTELHEEYEFSEIKDLFIRIFKVSPTEPIMIEASEKIEDLRKAGDKVILKEFAKVVFETIIKLLQSHLGFFITFSFSTDNKQIFLVLKTSEHNLKVQADIVDYKLQFNAEAAEINDAFKYEFQDVLPYAAFEKTNKDDGKSISKNSERFFQRYDRNGKLSEDGELFRFNDKIRLLHSIISSTFDLGELKNLEILINFFPLHNKSELQALTQNWANFSVKTFFKPQPIERIRAYFGEEVTLYFAWLEYYVK